MKKIVHLTSAHPRFDTRIYVKECKSLHKAGYEVHLVVADGLGDEVKDGIAIHDVGKPSGRWSRMVGTTKNVWIKALAINGDLYHLHDPELIPVGLKLKKKKKLIIFDAHEDVPNQIMAKAYLPKYARKIISKAIGWYEVFAIKKFDFLIAATPFIRDKFLKNTPHSVDVNNFPEAEDLLFDVAWNARKQEVCYIGGITRIRGAKEIVEALPLLQSKVRLNLAGSFSDASLEHELKALPGWHSVNELGFVDRHGVRKVLSSSMVGLVTLHPVVNYLDALPVKMFEYMMAGIPVIASNFPLWRQIVEDAQCGVCVNPLSAAEIAGAIDELMANPARAEQLGLNGKKAVLEKYNWGVEKQKLLRTYASICPV